MSDPRLPVRFVTRFESRDPDSVVVADRDARLALPADAVPVSFRAHDALCRCCGGRAPFAAMLGRLFAERARGERPFFRLVLAVSDEAGLEAARRSLTTDPFLAGRYKEDPTGIISLTNFKNSNFKNAT